MSIFNALLGAMNTGSGIYNADRQLDNTIIKDKASIDNTRANTALNRQSFDFNDKNNPIMIKARELAHKISQQSFDQNALMNPLNVTGKELVNKGLGWSNKTSEQTFNQKNKMNPLDLIAKQLTNTGLGFDNVGKNNQNTDSQRRLDDRTAFMANPDIPQNLKDAWQMNNAAGGKSFNPSSGKNGKPTILGTYNDAGFRTGNAVYDPGSNTGTPISIQGQSGGQTPINIQEVLGNAIEQTYGTQEFNDSANRADFNVRANEVYQAFLEQTNNPDQAAEMTKNFMNRSLSLDDDVELGFLSDKELDYNPGNLGTAQQPQYPVITTDEEYLKLPVGTTYIADGQIRVKK